MYLRTVTFAFRHLVLIILGALLHVSCAKAPINERSGNVSSTTNYVRARPLRLDTETYERLRPDDEIPLTLFDDRIVRLKIQSVRTDRGRRILVGRVENGWFSLVISGHDVFGNIRIDGTFFEISPGPNTLHNLAEISRVTKTCTTVSVDTPNPPTGSATDLPAPPPPLRDGDDGSEITVLVAFTQDVVELIGGAERMMPIAQIFETDTNVAFSNSEIATVVRVVDAVQVSYNETADLGRDLNALTNPNDGQMDEIHALRDLDSADLVVLVVGNGGGLFGKSHQMTVASPAFAGRAFSVITYADARDRLSFAHEIGHNMGANHDRGGEDPGDTPCGVGWEYNCGLMLRIPGGSVLTVMAKGRPSSDEPNLPRIPYFTNPNVRYNGVSTGIANVADNARVLNQTRRIVANFRVSAR